jgi:hypothetical protein
MGKLLKYCSSCEEGFAERFAFCPDCGAPLQAVEMNPVGNEAVAEDEVVSKPETHEAKFEVLRPVVNEPAAENLVIEPSESAPAVTEAFSFTDDTPTGPVDVHHGHDPYATDHVVEGDCSGLVL